MGRLAFLREPFSSSDKRQDNSSQPVDEKQSTHDDDQSSIIDVSAGEDAQAGVKEVEAITLSWTKKSLILLYITIFIVFFVNSLQQQTSLNLLAYVTSDFALHELIPTTSIVSSIVSGVIKLPIAKILDLWGRNEGFIFMVCTATIGLIMMAACDSVTLYAGAQVFYSVGVYGMAYVLDVIIADTSSLKNRALMFSFSNAPFIATAFAGPSAAQSFIDGAGWRWGYGTYSIVTPIMCIPIITILYWNKRKAIREGVLPRQPSGRTLVQSIVHYAVEFDMIGIILLCAGLCLFLLPFSLATSVESEWRSGSIIAMLVVGIILCLGFAVWERFGAIKPFLPWDFLTDRTILGACLLGATLFCSFYCWDFYLSSTLQVVWGLNIKDAGYVTSIYNVGSCFWGIVVAGLIRLTGRFKWIALCAMPVTLLGTGLMIHFRQPDQDIGYVVMTQIFIAFAGGTLVICQDIAAMAASDHSHIAPILALLSLFSSVGGAIGSSVSGAIWTNTLPGKLQDYLPEPAKKKYLVIYSDIVTQLSYKMGSPERDAIIRAYGETQRLMCIAATAIMAISFFWILMWRDIRIKDVKQTKGTVV